VERPAGASADGEGADGDADPPAKGFGDDAGVLATPPIKSSTTQESETREPGMNFTKLLAGMAAGGNSFLGPWEARAVRRIVADLPQKISAKELTRLSVAGAFIAAAGLLGCHQAAWPILLVPAGMVLNWFGATIDGPLSVHRGERDSELRLAQLLSDLFSQLLVITAYGFSPFLSLESSLVILVCFLLFSAYTYLRSAAGRVVPTSLIGLGATEFRILMAVWPFIAIVSGFGGRTARGFAALDASILLLAVVAILGLAVTMIVDGWSISSREN
jgi:hypothetical protein